ncbi:hypothetical protein BHE90_010327, partial [Fusarium euwallaceae]
RKLAAEDMDLMGSRDRELLAAEKRANVNGDIGLLDLRRRATTSPRAWGGRMWKEKDQMSGRNGGDVGEKKEGSPCFESRRKERIHERVCSGKCPTAP